MENHILLIDDDEDESILLEMTLKHCTKQAKVQQVMRFEQVVAFADTFLTPPHLIFLDLRLSNESGLDILAWIRSHRRLSDIPVVVWSHTASDDEIEQSYQRGGNYFFSKIADQSTTRESVSYICQNWLQ